MSPAVGGGGVGGGWGGGGGREGRDNGRIRSDILQQRGGGAGWGLLLRMVTLSVQPNPGEQMVHTTTATRD